MHAIRFHRFGGPEVLTCESLVVPVPGPGEIRVDLRAAAILPVDCKIRQGALKQHFQTVFPKIPGRDGAGVVGAVGPGVDYAQIGDRVCVVASHSEQGTYAQAMIRARDSIIAMPKRLDFSQAAALVHSGVCSVTCMFHVESISAGMNVLIHGGAGSIGTLAIQLAKARGAFVATTCSSSNGDYVRAMGADLVFAYDLQDFSTTHERFDVVLDLIGGEVHKKSYGVLRRNGHLVCLRAAPIQDLSKEYGVTMTMVQIRETPSILAEVMALTDAGVLKPQIHSVLPLARVQDGHALMDAGQVSRGRLVLDIPPLTAKV